MNKCKECWGYIDNWRYNQYWKAVYYYCSCWVKDWELSD